MGSNASKGGKSSKRSSNTTTSTTSYDVTPSNSKSNNIKSFETHKSTSSSTKEAEHELERLFDKYQKIDDHSGESDADSDYVGGDGIIQLVQDIGIDPMDVLVLMMLYKLDSKTQYRITRKEWMNGFMKHGIHSLEDMKQKIPQLKNQINSSTQTFKQFYLWCFNYVKDPEQKGMAVDTACQTWRVVLADKFNLLDDWCNFMQYEVGKTVQKDTWNLFYDFVIQVGDDLDKFEEGGAWPVAVDEFVLWMKEGKNVALRKKLERERQEEQ